MKNSILYIGGILIIINTALGLILSSYEPFNIGLSDVSILLTALLTYTALKSSMADGFKIGLTVLFSITGLARFICAVVSPEKFKDNFPLLIFLIFIALEGICLVVSNSMKNK
jgi:hypothetical protein